MSKNLKFSLYFLAVFSGFMLVIFIANPTLALTITKENLIGEIRFSTGLNFEKTEVGGLSGITYDASKQFYYAISDDRSQKNPARFYTLKIDENSREINRYGVKIVGVTTLLDEQDQPFAPLSIDAEGIAVMGDSLFIASEGDIQRKVNPFIRQFSLAGKLLKTLPIPEKFLPNTQGAVGVRNNLAFESLTVTPDPKYLFTATENALLQDGDVPTNKTGTLCRILRYNLANGQPDKEFVYLTEPLIGESQPSANFITNGLVDLVAISENHLLSLERGFSPSVGNTIRIFDISLKKADDVQEFDRLKGRLSQVSPVQKTLLLDLKDLNLSLDNVEGLALGSTLADGRRTLVLVSDNNFNPLQFTQFLVFGINFPETP